MLFRSQVWDARTRLPGQRTRVRRGGTWGRDRDAADRASLPRLTASCHVARPESGYAAEVGVDSAEIGYDAAKIGPTRSVSACIGRNGRVRPKLKKKKKKKKKCKRTILLT